MLFSTKKPTECPKGSFCSRGTQSTSDIATTDKRGNTFTKTDHICHDEKDDQHYLPPLVANNIPV